MMMYTAADLNDDMELADDIEEVLITQLVLLYDLTRERSIPMPIKARFHRTIESFPAVELHHSFRFRTHDQLRRLMVAFHIPNVVRLPYRNHCTGEEFLLIGLYRICHTSTLVELESVFGQDYTWISRVFDTFTILRG
jgi:hypothetical protein